MPRRSRKESNTSFFHVIVQGINKEYIFQKSMYKKKYLNLIMENYPKYSLKILAYCIMGNHTHLLIYSQKIEEISAFMKKINEDYARYYNFIENRVGYVFRDRFLTEDIISEKYLINCLVYIHNNPVKANIVKKCNEYQYSSYCDYINANNLIDNETKKLVFHDNQIDILEYERIHLQKDYYFKEYDNNIENNMKELIKKFESEYKKDWNQIIKENKNLIILIPWIKERMCISNYKLAKYFKIHRHKVEKILQKSNENYKI